MKIFINRKPVSGPWGGGNKSVTALHERLIEENFEIADTLSDDVKIIFCFDPRSDNTGLWYGDFLNHKKVFGSRIIQRVGDCGTHGKPDLTELVTQSTRFSDFVIFPSLWAKKTIAFTGNNFSIVPNGPHRDFYKRRKNTYSTIPKNLITHHWSTNPKKGFEFYSYIDKNMDALDINFTYIGRLPEGFSFKNANYLPPMEMNSISKELENADIYLTASLEEAGANHVLEALAVGLPVAYHSGGGSIVEYCRDYGVSFNNFDEMKNSINTISNDYGTYHNKIVEYNRSVDDVVEEYLDILCNQR